MWLELQTASGSWTRVWSTTLARSNSCSVRERCTSFAWLQKQQLLQHRQTSNQVQARRVCVCCTCVRVPTPSPQHQWPALVIRWPLITTPFSGSRQKNVKQWPLLVATVGWPPLHSNGGVQQWPLLVATVGCRASCTQQWPQLRARAPQKCSTVATKRWPLLVATVESRARPEGGDIQWPLLFFSVAAVV